MTDRIRVVIAKPGLDGPDRGAEVIARAPSEQGVTDVVVFGSGIVPAANGPNLAGLASG